MWESEEMPTQISIHALLAEGDPELLFKQGGMAFLSTPSLRRAT